MKPFKANRRRRHAARISLESLESRVVLSSLTVVNISPTESGFRSFFSDPIDRTVIDSADVVFRNSANVVIPGTVSVDADAKGVVFSANSGRLPGGNYSVKLVSAVNAFKAIDGTILDGNNDGAPGGDYAKIVNISAKSVTLTNVDTIKSGFDSLVTWLMNTSMDTGRAGNLPLAGASSGAVAATLLNTQFIVPLKAKLTGATTVTSLNDKLWTLRNTPVTGRTIEPTSASWTSTNGSRWSVDLRIETPWTINKDDLKGDADFVASMLGVDVSDVSNYGSMTAVLHGSLTFGLDAGGNFVVEWPADRPKLQLDMDLNTNATISTNGTAKVGMASAAVGNTLQILLDTTTLITPVGTSPIKVSEFATKLALSTSGTYDHTLPFKINETKLGLEFESNVIWSPGLSIIRPKVEADFTDQATQKLKTKKDFYLTFQDQDPDSKQPSAAVLATITAESIRSGFLTTIDLLAQGAASEDFQKTVPFTATSLSTLVGEAFEIKNTGTIAKKIFDTLTTFVEDLIGTYKKDSKGTYYQTERYRLELDQYILDANGEYISNNSNGYDRDSGPWYIPTQSFSTFDILTTLLPGLTSKYDSANGSFTFALPKPTADQQNSILNFSGTAPIPLEFHTDSISRNDGTVISDVNISGTWSLKTDVQAALQFSISSNVAGVTSILANPSLSVTVNPTSAPTATGEARMGLFNAELTPTGTNTLTLSTEATFGNEDLITKVHTLTISDLKYTGSAQLLLSAKVPDFDSSFSVGTVRLKVVDTDPSTRTTTETLTGFSNNPGKIKAGDLVKVFNNAGSLIGEALLEPGFKNLIPGFDRSLSDLVDLQSPLDAVLVELRALKDQGFDEISGIIESALGLPDNSLLLSRSGSFWKVGLSIPIDQSPNIDLGFDLLGKQPGGLASIVDVNGSGALAVRIKGSINLGLVFDLSGPSAQVGIAETSNINLAVAVDATNIDAALAVGPFGAFLQDGTFQLKSSTSPAATWNIGLQDRGPGQKDYYTTGNPLLFNSNVDADITASLPLAFPTADKSLGVLGFTVDLDKFLGITAAAGTGFNFTSQPTFPDFPSVNLQDLIGPAMEGLDRALGFAFDQLSGVELPLIGSLDVADAILAEFVTPSRRPGRTSIPSRKIRCRLRSSKPWGMRAALVSWEMQMEIRISRRTTLALGPT